MKSNTIYAAIGIIVGAISTAFGGWSSSLTTLVIFMAIDYLTGFIVAAVFNESKKTENGALESRAGFKGLCRKGVMLLIVLVACRLDLVLGSNFIRDGVIVAFLANEAVSIIENASLMGIPMPKVFIHAIEALKDKSDKGGGSDEDATEE